MCQEAGTFVRYRLTSLDVIRQADRDARRMLLSDLMELGRMFFHEMQLPMQLLSHFSPKLVNHRNNSKAPVFGEVFLPGNLQSYTADLSAMNAFFRPKQNMSNYVSRELARGKQKTPLLYAVYRR